MNFNTFRWDKFHNITPAVPNPNTFENIHPLSSNSLKTSEVIGKKIIPVKKRVPHHFSIYPKFSLSRNAP